MSNNIARVGDLVFNQSHSHMVGTPQIPTIFPVLGKFTEGSDNVFVNNNAIIRVEDKGTHVACVGSNNFKSTTGSETVFANTKAVCREGDRTSHCYDAENAANIASKVLDQSPVNDGVILGFCSHNTFAG